MLGVSPAQGVNPGLARLLLPLSLLRSVILSAVIVPGLLHSAVLPLAQTGVSHICVCASEHTVLLPATAKWQRCQNHFFQAVPEKSEVPSSQPHLWGELEGSCSPAQQMAQLQRGAKIAPSLWHEG